MKWVVKYLDGQMIVEAKNQFEAFDSLRDFSIKNFGLIVTALQVGKSESCTYPMKTEDLFLKWDRYDDFLLASSFAKKEGLI